MCWDLKTSTLLSTFLDASNTTYSTVTALAQCAAQPDILGAGYSDGSIRIWDALSGQVIVRFDGHRSAITHLCFDTDGERVVSGSRDTDVIVWDLVGERAEGRLRGHKGEITGLAFLAAPTLQDSFLLTTSKDALIKIWNLEGKYCLETHVAQTNGECWALGMSPDGDGCITAGNDGELRVWSIDIDALAAYDNRDNVASDISKTDILRSRGIIHRQNPKDRTIGVSFHPTQPYIAVYGSEKAVEILRIRGEEELHRHMQRKRRRRREKAAVAGETLPPEASESAETPDVPDVFVQHLIVRTGGRVRSTVWMTPKSSKRANSLHLLIAYTNNLLETYTIQPLAASKSTKESSVPDYSRALTIDLPGHRADARTLALSSDDRMLASASAGQLKIWNLRTRSCIRTLECGQALCSSFLPGDRMMLLGTKSGDLELYDLSTSSLIESLPAHDGHAIWTLAVHPDGQSVVTGSADKSVKFWRFDVIEEEVPGTRRTIQRLKLAQTRQLKLSDDILSLAFSPDSRLLAVSTLDNTVKVFFVDSLKLFLTLYGHKLPVLDMSISTDSKLIATCSADKNIRIWGLDFGDCHKAFFAHEDSIMAVNFISHPVEQDEKYILFSASKDGVVKTWDAQKFEQIQRLDGHKGEIWAMAISRTGELCVTASHDKSVRLWEIGDDLVFLEEERERELEGMYERNMAENLDRDFRDGEQENENGDMAVASKQTVDTLTHGEKVVEALELGMADLETMGAYERESQKSSKMAPPQRNPVFLALGNISAEKHVLSVLQKIPTPALNDALLVLPFSTLPSVFTFLAIFMRKRMHPELTWRIAYFLLQVHMKHIIASRQLKPLLEEVLEGYERWQEDERRILGFNLAGLTMLGRKLSSQKRAAAT